MRVVQLSTCTFDVHLNSKIVQNLGSSVGISEECGGTLRLDVVTSFQRSQREALEAIAGIHEGGKPHHLFSF